MATGKKQSTALLGIRIINRIGPPNKVLSRHGLDQVLGAGQRG